MKKYLILLLLSFVISGFNSPVDVKSASGQENNTTPHLTLEIVPPEELNFAPELTEWLDQVGNQMIENDETSGAVIAVGRGKLHTQDQNSDKTASSTQPVIIDGKIAYLKAFGYRQVEPDPLPMQTDSVFDLASITKSVSTSLSLAILYDEKKFQLDDPVIKYWPEFDNNGKGVITFKDFLLHVSGIKDAWIIEWPHDQQIIWEKMAQRPMEVEPGTRFKYTCTGFLCLGKLVEKLSGQTLKEFTDQRIYGPLGMTDTMYQPNEELQKRVVTTEFGQGKYNDTKTDKWIKGEVHDPQSWYLNGIAGNAGVFSTAPDLAVLGTMLLAGGTVHTSDGKEIKIVTPETLNLFTAPWPIPDGIRGLGWDKRSPYSSNRGWNFSPLAFGHSGFTGTVFWVDPGNDLFVILLGNRLHPKSRNNAMNRQGGKIGTIAVDLLRDPVDSEEIRARAMKKVYHSPESSSRKDEKVLNGIDVLERENFALLKDRKVGLITNHTGLNRQGESNIAIMRKAGVNLVALFSPEHGISGISESGNIDDSQDATTGLPIYSLYGETRRPTSSMLQGIDTLVFDIQDIGARFYTYMSTMGLAMQAAADHHLRFIVLDRINPIGGAQVAGPVSDPGTESFINFDQMPVRHGMTAGELALMFNEKQKLNLDLVIVPIENWKRNSYWEDYDLPWINPSPNMRNPMSEILYPGTCLVESSNISLGRGTEMPFEIMGAPWIDGEKFAERLNSRIAFSASDGSRSAFDEKPLAGIRFEPITFTPQASRYTKEECHGVRFILEDINQIEPVRMGIVIMQELYNMYPDQWEIEAGYNLLLHRKTIDHIKAKAPISVIESDWQPDFDRFMEIRNRFLIYTD